MTENWRNIPGWGGTYEVSDNGRVRRAKRARGATVGKILCQTDVRGYKRVDLFDGEKHCGQLVHRLVLSAFGGPLPDGKEAHHRDGNKGNNSIENLEYVTRSQNQIKSLESGRPVARGVHNGRARLSENDVREIRGLCANGASDTHIAQRYKIGRSTVWCIRNAETWRHVPLEVA
jgi:hypothetical protein